MSGASYLHEDPDLEYALYLLEAALEHERKRRWWQLLDCLWWGRVDQAASILRRRLK